MTGATNAHRTASQMAIGTRKMSLKRSETTIDASRERRQSGRSRRSHPVGPQRTDLPSLVDLGQRPRRGRHDKAQPEQGQRGSDRDDDEYEHAAALASRS